MNEILELITARYDGVNGSDLLAKFKNMAEVSEDLERMRRDMNPLLEKIQKGIESITEVEYQYLFVTLLVCEIVEGFSHKEEKEFILKQIVESFGKEYI